MNVKIKKPKNTAIKALFSYKESQDASFTSPGSHFTKVKLNQKIGKFSKDEKFEMADIFWDEGILALSRLENKKLVTHELKLKINAVNIK